jgi:hypothetical protein
VFIQVFPVGSRIEDSDKQICNPMLTTIETALSQHVWNVALVFQKGSSAFDIPTKEDSRCHGGCYHFHIAYVALFVFAALKSFQYSVAKYGYNLNVHDVFCSVLVW